jgi:hypothetical protein
MNALDKPPQDELEALLRTALAILERQELRVFWGSIAASDELIHAEWDTELEPGVEKFLECAKASGADLVFLTFTKFAKGALGGDGGEFSRGERVHHLEMVHEHEGEIAQISLAWTRDQTVFEYTRSAPWADDYFDLLEEGAKEAAEEEENEDDEPQIDEKEVARIAATLAMDPRFQVARSGAQHLYAARRALDGAVVSNRTLLDAVIEEAKSIFAIEIKPKRDRELAEQVEELRRRGLTKGQIAQRLNISANRMKTMF